MKIPNTPLFVKTHDFLVWLLRHSQRFPKNLRQSYTIRLENTAFEFQEALLMANTVSGSQRMSWLDVADGKLLCMRSLIRFALDFELLSGQQMRYAAAAMEELGRLLGAWKKGTGR
jgi:hypothetical protein